MYPRLVARVLGRVGIFRPDFSLYMDGTSFYMELEHDSRVLIKKIDKYCAIKVKMAYLGKHVYTQYVRIYPKRRRLGCPACGGVRETLYAGHDGFGCATCFKLLHLSHYRSGYSVHLHESIGGKPGRKTLADVRQLCKSTNYMFKKLYCKRPKGDRGLKDRPHQLKRMSEGYYRKRKAKKLNRG